MPDVLLRLLVLGMEDMAQVVECLPGKLQELSS
jgi:hypothetical protein